MKKNNSENKAYYSQRNNKIDPSGACNVTAMVQALVTAGWPLPKGEHKQPEDNLILFIRNDKEILREWKKIDPKGKYPPNQWHALLCLGTNRWLIENGVIGKRLIEFKTDVSLADFKDVIFKGGAAVFSGRFKTPTGTIGHIVAGVGVIASEDMTNIIIDDPWGDFHSLYKLHDGNDVLMSEKEFLSLLRPLNEKKKMAHIVPKFEKVKR